MSKCGIIFSGGKIEENVAEHILAEHCPDILVGVDGGLKYLFEHHHKPTHIVGDFDSVAENVLEYYRTMNEIEVHTYDPVKDATDTELAIRLAIKCGVKQLWILGATGTRIDHLLANIQCLKIAYDAGVEAYIVDANNRISVFQGERLLDKEKAYGSYFSLFPLYENIKGLTVRGAKYPLENYTLGSADSLGVSNRISDATVFIRVEEGIAILIESRD